MLCACLATALIVVTAHDQGIVDSRSLPSPQQLCERFERAYDGLKSLYVEYDVSVFTSAAPAWKLTGTVALALEGRKQWTRTVHFYPGLYEHEERPEYDPILNWILKTNDRFIRCEETTRQAIIRDNHHDPMVGLEIEGYTGYIAYLQPAHAADLQQHRASRDRKGAGVHLGARDYYLPWALHQPGWCAAPKTVRQGGVECLLFERLDGAAHDRIWLDPRRDFALLRRELKGPNGESLEFEYANLEAVTPSLCLPKQILVRYPDRSLSVRAKVVQVNRVPAGVFEPSLPPGTIVKDFQKRKEYILPGGEDLLDFTVERIRHFLAQSGAPGSAR